MLRALLLAVLAATVAKADAEGCDLAKVRSCYEDILDSVPLFFAAKAAHGDAAESFCSHYWEYSSCISKHETKACRKEQLVERMEALYRQVSAELCNDPELELLKSFEVDGDCSPLEIIRQCAVQTLQTFTENRGQPSACSTLELGLVRCLSEPSSMCRQPVQRAALSRRSVAAFLRWYGCQGPPPASTTPRPVDPFLEECPFQLHELCLTQSIDVMRALLLLYGQPGRNLSHFYEELCGEPPGPCRPEDSLDKCTSEQRGTLQRFHLAAVAAHGTLCGAPPQLLANLAATHSCWDEKAFRECVLGDARKPLGRHLLGAARTDEERRLLRSGWSRCLEGSFVHRCEGTPDVEGARGLLLEFLDRLQQSDGARPHNLARHDSMAPL